MTFFMCPKRGLIFYEMETQGQKRRIFMRLFIDLLVKKLK